MNPLRAEFKKFTLKFVQPVGTSRGVLLNHEVYILALIDERNRDRIGLGECAPLAGLSLDDRSNFAEKLKEVCDAINTGTLPENLELADWPAIRFGLEAARLDFQNRGRRVLFDSEFTRGQRTVLINGLVAMSDVGAMLQQALAKIAAGFDCIKIKIGALNFEAECELLKEIRKRYPASKIQLRLDANGAFAADEALDKIMKLSAFVIHSIEQPIQRRQWQHMTRLCQRSPIPIALDEELIGVPSVAEKQEMLKAIRPQFIVLKPTLLGGLAAAQEWIAVAERLNIGYWVTSALESNIGLNIISQWTATMPMNLHQGLGTGQLYAANFPSPLRVVNGQLAYSSQASWQPITSLLDLKLSKLI